MAPAPREFTLRADELQGFTDGQIRTHLDVVYVALKNRLTEVQGRFEDVDRAKTNPYYSDFREVKHSEVYLTNAVQLHELYFNVMEGSQAEPEAPDSVVDLLTRDFGSYEAWRDDFRAVARSARGWAVLAMNLEDGRLHNYLLDDNQQGVWNSLVILALDMHEHAYSQDYPGRRAAYVDAFLRNIRWDKVEQRLARADQMLGMYTER